MQNTILKQFPNEDQRDPREAPPRPNLGALKGASLARGDALPLCPEASKTFWIPLDTVIKGPNGAISQL